MLARIRKSLDEKDQGFTLIELLVVMIIIGILAAIAIPVFMNQRKKAVDSGIKSDLRTVAQAEETYFTDNQKYTANVTTATDALVVGSDTLKTSAGNKFTLKLIKTATANNATTVVAASDQTDATGFCLTGTNEKGSADLKFIYNSLDGGLKASTSAACPS